MEKDNREEGGAQSMRKFYKGSLIAAACLIGSGIVLTAIGGTAGIHKAYGIVRNEAGDWQTSEYWNVTNNMGESENTAGDESILNNTEVFVAENVDRLTIAVGACRLVLQEEKMDEDQIRVSCSGSERIKCNLDGDELSVKGYKRDLWSMIGNSSAPEIRITVPEERKFAGVELKTGAGQAEITGIRADEISVKAGAGEVIMNQVTADTMSMEAGAGSLQAEKMDVENIEFSVGAGSFNYEGKAPEELDADCAMGELVMDLSGKESDHNYSVRCAAGEVEIGNQSGSMLAIERYIDNGADSEYSVDCSMGTISITFTGE